MKKKTAAVPKRDRAVEAYAAEYMDFLAKGKTERRCYAAAVELLEKAGFRDLASTTSLKPGDRVYRGYHGKTLMACVIGREPTAKGLRVVGGHTDAPRLDLKPRPLYEKDGIVYLDTHMYGGIKKFQWLVLPLALYGVIVRKDGSVVEVAVGDEPGDPVFLISDILPHLGGDQAQKTQKEFYPAEDLDVIAGVCEKDALAACLAEKYGVEEADLLSAELEIVPAGRPREVGLDRSLIAAYGHDDRVCAYAGLSALVDVAKAKTPPSRTCACILCDKEEIGSVGASGMDSTFFENTVAELLEREAKGGARDIDVRRALEASTMLGGRHGGGRSPFQGRRLDRERGAPREGPRGGQVHGRPDEGRRERLPRRVRRRDPPADGQGRRDLADVRARPPGEGRRRHHLQVHGALRDGRARLRHAAAEHARPLGACLQVRLLPHEEGLRGLLRRLIPSPRGPTIRPGIVVEYPSIS